MNRTLFLSTIILLLSCIVLRAQENPATLSLHIPTVAAQPGQEVCLDITSENFDGIFGVSFTLLFDANALEYVTIRNINLPSATLGDNFNTMNAGTGEIRMLWTSLSTQDYPSPFTLFTICFKVKGTTGTIAPVWIADDPVEVEVIGASSDSFEDFVQGKFTNGAVWIRSNALPALPDVDGAITIFSCNEQWKAGLDISVTGGAPPYQFNWAGPDNFQSTEEDLPILDFGVYFLTVTDQNQSPAYATFYVIQPDGIGAPGPYVESVDITPATSCSDPDGAIVLNFNQDLASLSFSWSNGATTESLSGLAAGEYEVTIMNANGCSSTWSGTVPQANDFEIAVVANPAICLRERGGLTVTSPLGANYQYSWSLINGGTISGDGATVGSLPPGGYSVTVTETTTGCSKTLQTSVPASGSLPLSIETQDPGCDGAPGSATVQLPSGQFAVNWSTGDQTAQINNLPAGDYAVTVTDLAGGCVREEQVSLQPLQVDLVTETQCKFSDTDPDSVFVSIAPSGGRGPYTFEWSNGTITTSAGVSTLGDRLPGALFATVTDQDGCAASSEANLPCAEVWPGDTDLSWEVNHFDLLNIGLGYAATGPQRPNGSLEWEGQYLPDWGQATPESNVDYKHIDTDGNGVIEAQDTTAIAVNWSRVATHFRDPDVDRQPVPKLNGAPLLVEGDQLSSAGPNSLPIVLGTADQSVENVYGLAFSVHYQEAIVAESLWVDFTDSWLGEDGTTLLTIYRHFPLEKRVDIALVRTNGQGMSGFGTVARLVFRGNNQTNTPQQATVETVNPRAIDPAEKIVEVATGATQLTVDVNTSIQEPAWARAIRVFPVPASTELVVQTDGINVESLQIVNTWGQVVAVFAPQNVLLIQDLTPGLYLLRIQTPRGVVVRRWVKG